jgi:hypothetical protein
MASRNGDHRRAAAVTITTAFGVNDAELKSEKVFIKQTLRADPHPALALPQAEQCKRAKKKKT